MMPTKLNRRDFIRLCAGSAAAISMSGFLAPFMAEAVAAGAPPVIWIQGASCTGCSISILNTVHPDIEKVLLEVISMCYHPNIMAAAGDLALEEGMFKTAEQYKGKFYLVVEGAIPTGADGLYCTVGEKEDGTPITFVDLIQDLGSKAAAILAFGTCSAYGGIPATPPNPTGCKSVSQVVKNVPIINIPGCPPHPDWMVGTIAHVLLYGIPELDRFGRPVMFFDGIVHDNCPRRQYFDNAIFAKNLSEPGCLLEVGCKGPIAHCDSPTRMWNSVSWCIKAGAPCIACTEPQFPGWPMYERIPEMPIGPGITTTIDQAGVVLGAAAALGIGGHLAGNVATGRIGPKKKQEEGDN
jgi:hydrogenase small subunit